ncbi:hypothetical protein, partial [Corallococcus praedator]|uniref:hypothetical protein n=1 Tax=Corallococcus praedator TaxID=2316724 RepID=UPI001AC007F3
TNSDAGTEAGGFTTDGETTGKESTVSSDAEGKVTGAIASSVEVWAIAMPPFRSNKLLNPKIRLCVWINQPN